MPRHAKFDSKLPKIQKIPYHAFFPALSTLSGEVALLVGEECEAPSHSKDEGTHRTIPTHARSPSSPASPPGAEMPRGKQMQYEEEGAAEPIPTPSLCSQADKKLATTKKKPRELHLKTRKDQLGEVFTYRHADQGWAQ